mgnify:CR=1 FL=1
MEGRIREYLQVSDEPFYPYTNHVGYGNTLGAGDKYGNGNAFTYRPITDRYTGNDIVSFNGNKVYMIDGYALYITHIRKPWAMAKIIKNDLTTQNCYIGKINDNIVVASSLHEALKELRQKVNQTNDNDYDIAQAFVYAHPDYEKQYDWEEMVFWHSLSKFSCQQGRQRFSENAHKTKDSTATPKELIAIMKQSRAANIANIMEQLYLNEKK